MLNTFFLAVCCAGIAGSLVSGISSRCLQCICDHESNGCQPLDCRWDVNGYACGYFQIHRPYYIDCNEPRPVEHCNGTDDCWEKCSKEYSCATTCVRAYMDRYGNRNGAGTDCESYARLHNGGPNGANPQYRSRYEDTTYYWNLVQKQGCSKDS